MHIFLSLVRFVVCTTFMWVCSSYSASYPHQYAYLMLYVMVTTQRNWSCSLVAAKASHTATSSFYPSSILLLLTLPFPRHHLRAPLSFLLHCRSQRVMFSLSVHTNNMLLILLVAWYENKDDHYKWLFHTVLDIDRKQLLESGESENYRSCCSSSSTLLAISFYKAWKHVRSSVDGMLVRVHGRYYYGS